MVPTQFKTLTLLATAVLVVARPSFIAVPADQIAFIDLSNVHVRVPRQTLTPPPHLPQALYEDQYQAIPILPYPQLQQLQNQQLQNQQLQNQQLQNQQLQNQQLQNQQLQFQPQQQPIGLLPPPEPQRVVTLQQEASDLASLEASRLSERPPDFGEYVDFGAHTGDNGAFGWYADFPVNNHEHASSFKK